MRPRGTLFVVALVAGLTGGIAPLAAPVQAHAQEAPAPSADAAPPVVSEASVPAAQPAPAFPPREQAPRTLRAHWHVFAAFTIAWLLLFGYALALGRRFARIERSLDTLRA